MPQTEGSSNSLRFFSEEDAKPSLRKVPRLLGLAIRLLWAADHRTFAITAVLQMASGLGTGLLLVVGARVLREVIDAGAGRLEVVDVLPRLGLLAACFAATGFAGSALAGTTKLLTERAVRYFGRLILEVASAVDLASFEAPVFYDRLQRAQQRGLGVPLTISLSLTQLAGAGFGVVGISLALLAIEPLLLPLVVIGYLPLWVAARRGSEEMHSFSFGRTPGDRLRQHLSSALTSREEAAEVRSFELAAYLLDRWEISYAERIGEVVKLVRRHLRRSLAAGLVTSALQAGVFAALVWMLASGRTDVAGAATAAIAIQQLGAQLRGAVEAAASLYEQSLFLEDFRDFLTLRPEPVAEGPTPEPFEELAIEHLSFAYPGSERDALTDVTFAVRSGEIVALVGENGSGKTTLAKLLCQLYRPAAGRILWDGEDTAARPGAAWRRRIAVIFQDFVRHRLSAAENIGLGETSRLDDREAIATAAARAGADGFLAALTDGYDTVLSKEFDGGADLSVGQWQRVALARAFFRDAPFIVLDEPTAALDARAEHELFAKIRELAGGRTVLLISHRFSSVRSADRILVLHEGRLVESGTHAELMAAGGRYAEMFTLQASPYLDEVASGESAGVALA